MVGVDPRTIGPKLVEVPGTANEMRLSILRSGGALWCSLFVITRGQLGPYDVFHNVDRWAADDPARHSRLTLDLAHEILAESVLQRRLPGID